MTSTDPTTWNAGDFHQWERPESAPCTGCACCSARLCSTAAADGLPCVAIGRSAGYDLDKCPCAAIAAAHRQLTSAAASDPSHPDNAGRWSGDDAEWLYRQRNGFLIGAAFDLARAGVPVGITHDDTDPHPIVLTIELPDVGQVTWHLPENPHGYPFLPGAPWDGHDTATKYARVAAWLAANNPTAAPSAP